MKTLAFPYIWSNPHAGNDMLLVNALLRPRFTDLVTLMHRYGEATVLSTLDMLERSGELPPLPASEARDMLENIKKGYHEYLGSRTS